MDAAVGAVAGIFRWPCDMLDRQGYRRDDLGIFGWWQRAGIREGKIYLPLRITQNGKTKRTGSYELAFTPRRRLEEVHVSVASSDPTGVPTGALIWKDRALEYGQYLAGHPVFVDLPQLTSSGYYRIEIKVSFSEDRSQSDHFIVYHEEGAP